MLKTFLRSTALLSAVAFIGASAISQTAAQQKPAPALSSMSEGALFKQCDSDYKARLLTKALEACKLGLEKRKKEEKTYTPLLAKIKDELADEQAAAGDTACTSMDLPACQQRITAAKEFATTARVTALEAKYNRTLSDLRQRREAAIGRTASGNYDAALAQLRELLRFKAYVPSVDGDIERVTREYVQSLLSAGIAAIDSHNWEEASQRYQSVLDMDRGNASAASGLKTVERGRNAAACHSRALESQKIGNYADALDLVENCAIKTYPEDKTYEATRNQISRDWVKKSMSELPGFLANLSDFRNSREAYLILTQVLALDPANAEAKKHSETVKENLGANALQKSDDLEKIVDYSRIGTSYVVKHLALELVPSALKPEDLKSAGVAFNRKRKAQMLLSIDNLGLAKGDFVQAIQNRARAVLDKLEFSDLRVRMLDDYLKTPDEDPQFQDLRPAGKSRTALVTIAITKHESERESSPTPKRIPSRYISGTESVTNPAYQKALDEVNRIIKALQSRKDPKKPTEPEGWTNLTLEIKQAELNRIPPMIDVQKTTEYSYSEIDHKQHTTVELSLALRDYASKQPIADTDRIREHIEREAREILGVRETDANGKQNEPVLLPSTDTALRQAERTVNDQVDAKLLAMLPRYINRFYDEGEAALKAKRTDDAVEAFLCHWAFYRGNLPADQLKRVADLVRKETGFDLIANKQRVLGMMDTAQ